MGSILFGYGVLTDATADRIRHLAEKHKVRFVRDPSRFRVEADEGADGAPAFTAALKRDEAFYKELQKEADLFDAKDDEEIPW